MVISEEVVEANLNPEQKDGFYLSEADPLNQSTPFVFQFTDFWSAYEY